MLTQGTVKTDLQGRADGDDLVALGGIDLQQYRNGFLQHWTADVVETPSWLVHSDVGNLAVPRRHCRFRDTQLLRCMLHRRTVDGEEAGI